MFCFFAQMFSKLAKNAGVMKKNSKHLVGKNNTYFQIC